MKSSDRLKDYDDPLMGRVSGRRNNTSTTTTTIQKEQGRPILMRILTAVFLVTVLGILAYFLYDAQQQIEVLNAELVSSQQQLIGVTRELGDSKDQIVGLEKGLSDSRSQLSVQRRELSRSQEAVTGLKEAQTAQNRELQALSIRKADQSQLDTLKDEAAGLGKQIVDLDGRVTQTNSNVSDLRELATSNSRGLQDTNSALDDVRTNTAANATEISNVKRSMERDYYNFELRRNGGVMKVGGVALSLKKVDFKKQTFNLEILTDGKRIVKKKQAINEPVYFFVGDNKKPFELRVNRIDKGQVVGYVSIPKT